MAIKKILFVGIHNSARSVMAEGFANKLCGAEFRAESAGVEPGALDPLVIDVMLAAGIDISNHRPRAISEVVGQGTKFDFVITVCDECTAERCPAIPGGGRRLHWSFSDPSAFQGRWEEKLAETMEVRDQIRAKIRDEFCPAYCCLERR